MKNGLSPFAQCWTGVRKACTKNQRIAAQEALLAGLEFERTGEELRSGTLRNVAA